MKTFKSPADFAAYLEGLRPALERATVTGIRDGGTLIQEGAKSVLGRSQGAAGPFPEWAALAERTVREREERGLTPDDPLLATSELHDHIDVEFEARKTVVGVPFETVGDGSKENPSRNIGVVAILMEQGNERIPPRSFLGRAAFVGAAAAVRGIRDALGRALAGLPPITRRERDHDIPF